MSPRHKSARKNGRTYLRDFFLSALEPVDDEPPALGAQLFLRHDARPLSRSCQSMAALGVAQNAPQEAEPFPELTRAALREGDHASDQFFVTVFIPEKMHLPIVPPTTRTHYSPPINLEEIA